MMSTQIDAAEFEQTSSADRLRSRIQELEHEIDELKAECREVKETATREISRAREELQQFVYVASHDLQEPLRTASGFAQMLQRRYRYALDKDADEFIDFIVDATKRMTELIRGLLAYSRASKGTAVQATMVDTVRIVEAAIQNLRPAIDEAAATVTTSSLPVVTGDGDELTQLFQNLISNAIRFRRPGTRPEVRVDGETTSDGWRFSVTDNGIGIQPEYRDQVFLLFKRLHGNDVAGGGIGLAIAKRIVERHRGRIWVEATEDGGSRFVFTVSKSAAAE